MDIFAAFEGPLGEEDDDDDDEGDPDDNQVEWCVNRFSLETSANLGKLMLESLRAALGSLSARLEFVTKPFDDSKSKLTRCCRCEQLRFIVDEDEKFDVK